MEVLELTKLKDRDCISCHTELSSLSKEEIDKLLLELNNEWEVVDGYLQKKFKFPDFNQGLNFTNKICEVCDKQKHHPIIQLSWGSVLVMLKTFNIRDISINDFILAAKIDDI